MLPVAVTRPFHLMTRLNLHRAPTGTFR